MERIGSRQPIAVALDLLPPGLRRRVEHADFLTGVHPGFVGLHDHATRNVGGRDGTGLILSYGDVAHVAWLSHQEHLARSDRRTTVVLPRTDEYDPLVLVHELGHVLDDVIGVRRHTPDPVSWYARENTWEAFAEAFVCYVAPDLAAADKWSAYDLDVARADARTVALFDELDA